MSSLIGTRIVSVAGTATLGDRTLVAAGDSALILGVYVAETTGTGDDLIFTSGGTTILTMSALDATAVMDTPFIVSDGFIVGVAEGGTFTTVIFRPGA